MSNIYFWKMDFSSAGSAFMNQDPEGEWVRRVDYQEFTHKLVERDIYISQLEEKIKKLTEAINKYGSPF